MIDVRSATSSSTGQGAVMPLDQEGISLTERDQAFRVWLSIGIAMLLVGFYFTTRTVQFLRTAQHAQGTIISRAPTWGACRFTVTVEFNGEGNLVRFPQCVQIYAFRFPSGKTVPVLYNPQHPDQAVINSFWRVWNIWAVFLPLGLFLCLGAYVIRSRPPDASGAQGEPGSTDPHTT